ncbi:MAG: bifunctional glutamate N-acetyltransferase/amino-acid acetyltransferase ArgJ [Victivallales bacterium]|jgi:glutamate N-acetyltransferase/amino-acid N-acetyltransferase|nr:bifunctional glutamate N-acetyltransferase/amino-acid acetyltransferase ArgJ [Victivallales bacterium]
MDKFKRIPHGSVTSPRGFQATGVAAGFKRSGALDFALLVSDVPANFAGAFTSCLFAAAPVQVCRKRVLASETIRAAVINSGNANACTGESGLANAEATCVLAANKLKLNPDDVVVSSTGRIGTQLPMETIKKGLELAVAKLSADGGNSAARAIMTTDTVPKSMAIEFELDNVLCRIGAMTKGAGMIDPSLKVPHATMLCYITTDVKISNELLAQIVESNAEKSFNRITVDGDMSTNDTVIVMANGLSKVEITPDSANAETFRQALLEVMQQLAREMVMDGEGVTKFVHVEISNAQTQNDAKLCAEAIANSLLCKTAWFGGDPNWGRVVAALGYSGAQFTPEKVDVFYDKLPVVKAGGDAGTSEDALSEIVRKREFTVAVDLHDGEESYWVWTNDISYDYVKINADYHT